jgi:hypothetical protein
MLSNEDVSGMVGFFYFTMCLIQVSLYFKVGLDVRSMLVRRFDEPQAVFHADHLYRIVVYTPQIIENYQLKSGEGLSTLFVYVWLAGDFANLSGAILAGLLPTIIIIALYVSSAINIVRGENSVTNLFCLLVHHMRPYPSFTNVLLRLDQLPKDHSSSSVRRRSTAINSE